MNSETTGNNIPLESQVKKAQFLARLHETQAMYWNHITSARMLFQNDVDTFLALGLQERRKEGLYPWTRQAKAFYLKALRSEEVLEKLTAYGITKEDLEVGLVKLKALEGNKFWKKQTHAEYLQSDYECQQAFAELHEWMEGFENASRQAFKDKPEYLVTLGFEKSVEDALDRQKRDERRKWLLKENPGGKTGENTGENPETPGEEK